MEIEIMKIGDNARHQIREAMLGLSRSAARLMADALAKKFGCSVKTVYRISRDCRKRKTRADTGRTAIGDPRQHDGFLYAAGLTLQSGMKSERALEIAASNNRELPVSATTFNRYLRSVGLGKQQIKRYVRPCRRFEAAAPNVLWQMDFTRAEQFYIRDDGGIGHWHISQHNKNRRKNRGLPLWVYATVDDYSRARFRMAFPGLATVYVLEFLYNAFAQKQSEHPLCGLPAKIYTDNDAVLHNEKFLSALETLQVEHDTHLPASPKREDAARAKGKVENSMKALKEQQTVTVFQPFQCLSEFNEYLFWEDVRHGNTYHGTTHMRPFQRWCVITDLRLAPQRELYELFFRDRCSITLRPDFRISINGREWLLPYEEPFISLCGQRTRCIFMLNPKEPDSIALVHGDREYPVKYREPAVDVAGQIRSIKRTESQVLQAQLMDRDYSQADLTSAAKTKYQGTAWSPLVMPQIFDESKIPAPDTVGLSRIAAMKFLQDQGVLSRPISLVEKLQLEQLFGDRSEIPEAELRDLLRAPHSPFRIPEAAG